MVLKFNKNVNFMFLDFLNLEKILIILSVLLSLLIITSIYLVLM